MKNAGLFICLIIISFSLSAQNQSIDSLKNRLKTLPEDSIYVNVLNDITTSFIQAEQFDSALSYAKPALDLSEKLAFLSGSIAAYYNMAQYNFHIHEYKPGKAFLLKSLDAALQVGDKRNIANNYKALANLYHLQGNFKVEADNKNKFILYNDSVNNEENAKLAAAIAKTNALKEKENAELAAKETKVITENEAQKQQIFYISLIVLIILSILIIWLLVSRLKSKSKKQAAFGEEHAEAEQVDQFNNLVEQKNKENDTPVFLQKIVQQEVLWANSKPYEKRPAIPISSPIELLITPKNIEENTESDKKDVEDGTQIKTVEPEEFESNPIEKKESTEENKVEIPVIDAEIPAAKSIGGNYSTMLSSDQTIHFTAKLIDDKVKLVWKTNSEQNMVGFELEKSVDEIQFVTIETITTNGGNGYLYETFDFKPLPGKNYYRLKINDPESNFVYSPVVQIEVLPATTLTLVCYPTHAKDVIMVTASGGKLPVVVSIYDTAGKKQFFIEVPPTTTPIYLSSLADGTYSLQMKCQGKTVLQQLIKKS